MFAATVCIAIKNIAFLIFSVLFKINTVKGTKVISATSFVINIDEKNVIPIIAIYDARELPHRERKIFENTLKTLFFAKPEIIIIKQKSPKITFKSIYDMYFTEGGVKKQENTARINERTKTGSFLKYKIIFFIICITTFFYEFII
jgi:hypothetical protein